MVKNRKIEPDYSKMAEYFMGPIRTSVQLDLMRCYFYYCPPWTAENPTDDEVRRLEAYEEFVEGLESLDRWALRQGKLEKRFDGKKEYFEQKRVDVLLSCDLVRHAAAGHIQHAVLVAGDSDFIPAVEAAKDSGVTITLFTGDFNTVHNDLIVLSDEVYQFDWRVFPKSGKDAGQRRNQPRAKAVNKKKREQAEPKRRSQSKAPRSRRDSFDPKEVEAMKKELGFTDKIKKIMGK